jgi:hypothetical protein
VRNVEVTALRTLAHSGYVRTQEHGISRPACLDQGRGDKTAIELFLTGIRALALRSPINDVLKWILRIEHGEL